MTDVEKTFNDLILEFTKDLPTLSEYEEAIDYGGAAWICGKIEGINRCIDIVKKYVDNMQEKDNV